MGRAPGQPLAPGGGHLRVLIARAAYVPSRCLARAASAAAGSADVMRANANGRGELLDGRPLKRQTGGQRRAASRELRAATCGSSFASRGLRVERADRPTKADTLELLRGRVKWKIVA